MAGAFTPNDPAKTVLADGSLTDTTNGFNYIISKAQDGWVETTGTAGGSYTWADQATFTTTNSVVLQGPSSVNRITITVSSAATYGISLTALASNHVFSLKDMILTDTSSPAPYKGMLGINGAGVCFVVTNVTFIRSGGTFRQLPETVDCGSPNNLAYPGPYGAFLGCSWIGGSDNIYGVFVRDNGGLSHLGWARPNTWGTVNAVYFENCFAVNQGAVAHAGQPMVDGDCGARVVIRYCNLTNYTLGWHGIASGDLDGTMQVEAYKNVFECHDLVNGLPYPYWLRGGSGVFWSNTLVQPMGGLWAAVGRFSDECASADWAIEHCPAQLHYPADYPAPQGIGQGVTAGSAPSQTLVPVYCWSNSLPSTFFGYLLGLDAGDQPFIQQGRDIYTNSPMPSYTPLPYPYSGSTTATRIARVTNLHAGKTKVGP